MTINGITVTITMHDINAKVMEIDSEEDQKSSIAMVTDNKWF